MPDHPETLNSLIKSDRWLEYVKEGQVIKSVYEKQCQKAIDTGLQTVVNTDLLDDIQVLITVAPIVTGKQIGRASCRERV